MSAIGESREFQLQEMRNYKIIKSNDLIQKTRSMLNALEQKIIMYLLSKIKPDDLELEESEFRIREFCELCKNDVDSGANYKYIKNILKNLRDKSIWFRMPSGSQRTLAWFSVVDINENSGIVKIKFDDLLKPHLLELKERFTQFGLYYVLPMKSQYSIRLYEILKSYENLQGWKFDLEELKKLLSAETYSRYVDFRKRALDTAIREINEYGDISVNYTIGKIGKKVKDVIFQIRSRVDIQERIAVWSNIECAMGKNKN